MYIEDQIDFFSKLVGKILTSSDATHQFEIENLFALVLPIDRIPQDYARNLIKILKDHLALNSKDQLVSTIGQVDNTRRAIMI